MMCVSWPILPRTMVAAEYTRLETDLNKGAAGHFVYLCYKKGRDEPPISDLCAPPLPMLLLPRRDYRPNYRKAFALFFSGHISPILARFSAVFSLFSPA